MLLKLLPHKHFQELFHAQAETVDFSFVHALHLALKMEGSVNQNSYLPFLEVSLDSLNNIQAHNYININKMAYI